jgi:hypothetical protein
MKFNPTSHLNPELVKSIRITLPLRRIPFVAGLTLAFVLVVLGLLWNNAAGHTVLSLQNKLDMFGQDSYAVLTVVLFGLLFVVAPAATALSFLQEKLRGTFIFQQMVMLTPFEIATGKFLGSSLIIYLVAALILPFALITASIGDVDADRVMGLYLFLIVGGLSFQAIGLFVSTALLGPSEKAARGGLLAGPAVGLFGGLAAIFFSNYFHRYVFLGGREYAVFWHFYGVRFPAYILVLALALFAGVWAFAGSVRKIKMSQLIATRPWPVWLFLASAEGVLVGLLWGSKVLLDGPPWELEGGRGDLPPIAYTVFYLVINWIVLLVLSGAFAMDRGRLREWWSADRGPFSLFQRGEIKNGLVTFVVALAVAEIGLIAIWTSYHDFEMYVKGRDVLGPVAIGFALTMFGMAAFVQFCAMHRFRARGWAGVALTLIFFTIMAVAGAAFDSSSNVANLLNPALFAYALCEGDPYMEKVDTVVRMKLNTPTGDKLVWDAPVESRDTVVIKGLLAESLLALGCFGLAMRKWKKTGEEILRDSA